MARIKQPKWRSPTTVALRVSLCPQSCTTAQIVGSRRAMGWWIGRFSAGIHDPTSGSAGIWKIPGILWRVWMVLRVPKSPKSSEEFRKNCRYLEGLGGAMPTSWIKSSLPPCFQKCMSSHETRHMSYCKRLPTRNGCHKLQQLLHNCKWLWSNDLGQIFVKILLRKSLVGWS